MVGLRLSELILMAIHFLVHRGVTIIFEKHVGSFACSFIQYVLIKYYH